MTSASLSNAVTGTLTLCAVVLTATVLHRDFVAPSASAANPLTPVPIKNGAALSGTGSLIGASNAPIKVVVFSDFQCPYCKRLHYRLDTLLARHPSQIAVVFRHFPLPSHLEAKPAAIAAECASQQSEFKRYADLLFERQDSLASQSWQVLAARAGVRDTNAFKQCIKGGEAERIVDRDVKVGQSLALAGTPAVVIGDEMIRGAAPLDTLEAWVGKRLKR